MKKQNLITPFSTRQYMFSRDFEIYYYSDVEKKAVRDHSHDYYEFYFFLEGNVDLVISGVPTRLKPGDFIIIPPGVSHHPAFHDDTIPYRRFVLWISAEYCNRLMSASFEYGYLMQLVSTSHNYVFSNDLVSSNELQAALFSIIEEVKGNRFGKDAMVSLRINNLLLMMNRMVYERRTTDGKFVKERLSAVLADYIQVHLEEDLSLERLEKEFYVTKYHIEHVFKEDYGISLHKYIQMKRLHACKDAIHSQKPIQDTYLLYGFKDYSAFFKAFKKEFGMSPKEYQTLHK